MQKISAINISPKKGFFETTCPYCGVGCGVTASVDADDTVSVKGRKDHPANSGRLCVKGSALHETLDYDHRLLTPKVNGKECDWHSALDYTANTFKKIIAEHGPQAVAFYLSGQLLTEDYYVANKLMKGYIGTANVDTNSRLCMASAVVAHKRAFGADAVPACYEDLELADTIFIVGSNTAYAHPIVFQRIAKAKKERPTLRIVVIDPRRTATCEIADLHIALKPGSDGFFFNGLLAYIAAKGNINKAFTDAHCDGLDEALLAAQQQTPDLDTTAKLCGLSLDQVQHAFDYFIHTDKVVSVFSMGINQSSSGVDKGNAIINCHLASGKIGYPGAAPFSITGQPNAMGGREVGGLANQLAAHMGFGSEEDIGRVERFWQAPNMARSEGLKAVDMFEAVHSGEIKAIWIMATNPVVSMPDANFVREALQRCELVVVSDCMANTDTGACADVLLPATGWAEKHGTVTNSERCISLQAGFRPIPGEARHDWQIMCDFAARLGYGDAFDYHHPVDIFREHAALSGFENNDSRAFDISALSQISLDDYNAFTPTQWPINAANPHGKKRLFDNGLFYTDNRRAKLIPIDATLPRQAAKDGEFILNTGRIRDQWHTMTRTGKAPRLMSHSDEPFIQIHPEDALRLGASGDDILILTNRHAHYLGKAVITTDQQPGQLFVPMHWTSHFSACSRVDALVNPYTDSLSGQPEFKQSPVQAEKFQARWHGCLLLWRAYTPSLHYRAATHYWSKSLIDGGSQFYLAHDRDTDFHHFIESQFADITDWVIASDNRGSFRAAGFQYEKLCVVFFASGSRATLPNHQWAASQLGEKGEDNRYRVLSGQAQDGVEDVGAIICSCYQVGEKTILKAIGEHGCHSAEALGETLKCGTNCGSCIPELVSLISQEKARETINPALK